MSTRTLPRGTRRWLSAGALVALLVTTTTACYGTWGIRESYRAYTQTPFADGEITTEAGATWLDGPGAGKGPFQWTVASAQLDPGTETGFIQFSGGVHTAAHPLGDGFVMETSFWNPRLELDGDTGTLVVDLNYRPYVGPAPAELPDLEAALDVDLATVDLSGFDWTLHDGTYTITAAPMTGIPAAMDLISWDEFYPETPVALDPLTVSFNASLFAPSLVSYPRLTVSKTTGLHVGDTVIVSGSGFDPGQATGTRPPLSGQPSGSYVTFGRFADNWKPSAGAPSSSRPVISQRWALPEPSFTTMSAGFPNPAYAPIDQYGNFEVTVELTGLGSATTGTYGIYAYPGSGAVNATYELATPIDVAA